MTNRETGQCGYQRVEDAGVKVVVQGRNDVFANHEYLTALAMTARMLVQGKVTDPLLAKGARYLAADLPVWDKVRKTNDYCYWHEGTFALFHYAGPWSPRPGSAWGDWYRALQRALIPNQEREGCARGSWTSDDRWGFEGGRVCATALNALSLEMSYRYPYLLGGIRPARPATVPGKAADDDD